MDDFELALLLQATEFDEQLDTDVNNVSPDALTVYSPTKSGSKIMPRSSIDRPLSVVDPQWELLDPNPDARTLFLEFNEIYFYGKLSGVEVKWSPRMTSCAGVCSYEGRGGLCSIRLSLPLLKLRPRKDLVETLLHEMIHALLFVTDNNKDHDGHGPEFHKHMYRINKASGSNITVYHNFHDEVRVYLVHWWKCDGPCQKRPPYFGLVKRSMNRAPGPNDRWWNEHRQSCGGTYHKIKEPEGFGQKKAKKKEEKNNKSAEKQDIRKFWNGSSQVGSSSKPAAAGKPLTEVVATGGIISPVNNAISLISSDQDKSNNKIKTAIDVVQRRIPGIGIIRSERPQHSRNDSTEQILSLNSRTEELKSGAQTEEELVPSLNASDELPDVRRCSDVSKPSKTRSLSRIRSNRSSLTLLDNYMPVNPDPGEVIKVTDFSSVNQRLKDKNGNVWKKTTSAKTSEDYNKTWKDLQIKGNLSKKLPFNRNNNSTRSFLEAANSKATLSLPETSSSESFSRKRVSSSPPHIEQQSKAARGEAGVITIHDASESVQCPVCSRSISANVINEHLDVCFIEQENESSPVERVSNEAECPICSLKVSTNLINEHIDMCLMKN